MSDQKIQELIDNGYEFSARAYIREAWSIFKQEPGNFIGFFLVFIFISMFISVIPFIGPIANYLIVSPVGAVGFYIVAHRIQKGENVSFSDFFKGFEQVVQLALMSLVLWCIYLLLFSPSLLSLYRSGVIEWYQELMANPLEGIEEMPPFTGNDIAIFGFNILPLLYVGVAYMWAPLFIVFYQKGFWDGLETSRKLITRKWFSVFKLVLAWIGVFVIIGLGMGLLVGLGAMTSMVLSGILIFFGCMAMFLMLPVVFISYYTSFAAVTGLLEEDRNEADILNHLVD